MSDQLVHIEVEETDKTVRVLELPTEISLSLMEVLKASDYPIEATCGGIALCATCHIEVIHGIEKMNPPTDPEMEMIDTLPNATSNSRLACQVRLTENLEGVRLRLMGNTH